MWKITFFGLKSGQDLENRAAHPHQEFPGVLGSRVGRELSARNSFIVSLTQAQLFICFCKVKYFGKVANVNKVRFRGGDNVLSFLQLCGSMSPTSHQLWIIVDHEHNR